MNDVNCKHSNGIVPYMYGELATSAATEFETHLLECQECTDEFAALSAARYEVYDWKKLDFDPLATPIFEAPYEEAATVSWVEKLRAAFSGWAMPAAAFGGVAIIVALVGVFALSRYQQDPPTIASKEANLPANDNTNITRIAPSSNVSQPEPATKEASPAKRSIPQPVVVSGVTPRRPIRTPQTVSHPTTNVPRATKAQTQTVPRLNEFSEEEDSSLRLAELFEDIDTRD